MRVAPWHGIVRPLDKPGDVDTLSATPMHPTRFVFPAASLLAVVLAVQPARLRAQDPIIKPIQEPTSFTRLPAPGSVTARQLPDGRIEVSWSAVPGATRYQLTRSVPPNPTEVVQPDPAGTSYIDQNVRVGSTYYYLVGAYSSAGTLGLKAGSSPVTATIPLGGQASQPPGLSAQLVAPTRIQLTWNPQSLKPEDLVVRSIARTITTSSGSSAASIPGVSLATGQYQDVFDFPAGAQVSYRIPLSAGLAMVSSPVTIAAANGGGTSNVANGSAASGGSTTFTVVPAVTLRVNTSSSLAASGGNAARWVSMNETVATVDAAGTVTARAAGTAQIVALSTAADGSLRVTNVPVAVTP